VGLSIRFPPCVKHGSVNEAYKPWRMFAHAS
jgi:hypothetical protein